MPNSSYAKRKKKGQCIKCERPLPKEALDEGHVHCFRCRADMRKDTNPERERRRADGKCTYCEESAEKNLTLCAAHAWKEKKGEPIDHVARYEKFPARFMEHTGEKWPGWRRERRLKKLAEQIRQKRAGRS